MTQTLSLREINQNFAYYIRTVETGNKIILFDKEQDLTITQQAARKRLLQRMKEDFS